MMRTLLFVGIAILSVSCEYDDLGLASNPIDSKIVIVTREVLGPGGRRVTFHCRTEKSYPCSNFPILTEQDVDESAFEITFTAVGETMLCLTALGPARTVVDLDALRVGEYAIAFNNAKLANLGTLTVTSTDIRLDFEQENGIEIVRPVTNRVPENTYWGRIGYHTESSSDLVDAFIQKFADHGATFSKQTPGHYFYYEIDDAGEIITNTENSGYYFVKAFIFQYTGDESALKELVQVEGENYREDLSISVYTSKGGNYNNWSK